MLTIFFDINTLLMSVFKDPDITINAHSYCGTLQDLYTTIKRKHPSTFIRGVISNTHPHVAHTTQGMLCSEHWKVLDHHPYSLNLLPYDFHVFGPLKKVLKGHKFRSNEQVKAPEMQWFQKQPSDLSVEGTDCFGVSIDACFNAHGDYFKSQFLCPEQFPKVFHLNKPQNML
jgi:hypothetical protein